MNGSWDAYLASPVDFAGMDDIISNLAKEREPIKGHGVCSMSPRSIHLLIACPIQSTPISIRSAFFSMLNAITI